MTSIDPTFVGQVASVAGNVVRVRLRDDLPTRLVFVDGKSYRVGQVGGFFRIPIGYTQLFAVCSQVGADAAPHNEQSVSVLEEDPAMQDNLAGFRWMTLSLFGEAVSSVFERGVGQYPVVGDEVHFVTDDDLEIIYAGSDAEGQLRIGDIASASGITASLNLDKFVSRHSSIVGSTGAGKSNLVAVLLEEIAANEYQSARVIVVDPHGEYANVAPGRAKVFRVNPQANDSRLLVPYWALPFDELMAMSFGGMQPAAETSVRDKVQELKREAANHLNHPPAPQSITADSPIPFSIRQLWFDLDDFERRTFRSGQPNPVVTNIVTAGDANALTSNIYEPYQQGSAEPFKNRQARNIAKQLELARSRLTDTRYDFLFNPEGGYAPLLNGQIENDLDHLLADLLGHDRPITVLDVSEVPADVAPTVVGLLARLVYDMLFWAGGLDIGGRNQPLLLMIDEAHRFLPSSGESASHRAISRIAKEGRKYGVGISAITQRPSELDATILSQCGTMIALRTTNSSDRGKITGAFPDDLGGLVELLPALRTGEALMVGEAMFVPSRVRIRMSKQDGGGGDPPVNKRWKQPRPNEAQYSEALSNWRNQVRG